MSREIEIGGKFFLDLQKQKGILKVFFAREVPARRTKKKKSSTDIQIMHEKLRKVRISASLHESEIHSN